MPVTIEIAVGAVTSRFTCDGDVPTLLQLFLANPLSEKRVYEAALREINRREGASRPDVEVAAGFDWPGGPAPGAEAAGPSSAPNTAPEVPKGSQKVPRRADLTAPRPTATRQGLRDYDDGAILTCLRELATAAGRQRIRIADLWPAAERYGVIAFSCRRAVQRLIDTGEVVRLDQRSLRLATSTELDQRPDRPVREIITRTIREVSGPAPADVPAPSAPPWSEGRGEFARRMDAANAPPAVSSPPRVESPNNITPADTPPAAAVAAPAVPVVRTIQERRADIRRVLRDVLNEEARCGLKALQASVKADVEDATDSDVEYVLNTLRNENQIGVMTIGTERVYSRRPTVAEIV